MFPLRRHWWGRLPGAQVLPQILNFLDAPGVVQKRQQAVLARPLGVEGPTSLLLVHLVHQPANPTEPHTREHCRIRIPHPEELIKRVEGVFQHFHLATDPNGRPLFKASLLKCWRIQRIHILRGCLSDPEVEGGIMYRHGGTLQLNHVPGEGAKVPVWIPIRGTSQQEGYHFHQAQWVTGTRVSTELFQAQAMTGVARWNYQRLVDLKQPDVELPAVFDPALMGEINAVSQQHRSKADSTQALDTPPQSSNPTAQSELLQPPSIPPTKLFQFPANLPSVKQEVTAGTTPEPHTEPETTCLKSLLSSPTAARTGPYVKHLSKLLNTSTSINISPEKLQERRVLWHSLTEGSETTSVPVVTMLVAVFNPTPPVQTPATPPVQTPATPLTQEYIENIVRNIMDKQQQQQPKKQTTFLSCGQPKARFENDGYSIHHLYMHGTVRYFYCSTNVFKAYGAEGLTDPKMPFRDFAETAFFQQELEAMKQRVEARVQQKRKNTEPEHKGCKCGFCRKELKQGPNSPHIHTGFPGKAGKYVFCPAKVLSLYRDQGMEKQMTSKNFKESAFYEAEKKRWEAEKGK
ncbi:hypothetical protein JOQ06_022161 [Pogonophryne albipinna]|uniref:Uncharacterized protein n=1 Tax=Pogonophryne albipinna TaxID=1090488 RepID=A0AAD6A6F9_9TELE|nr:hypothetical protein JOQ06_022161 [Pogonophryne albipinna]